MANAKADQQRTAAPLLELVDIGKSFGDLVVASGVNLTLGRGQVHALLGENGAGKTTLMRILYGLTRPDAGSILVNGEPLSISTPADAIAAGIGMVTQHFSLVGPMTVAENVMLSGVGVGRIDRKAAAATVREAAARIGVDLDPTARVDSLSVGEQQRLEIVKALARDCKVLILDEPTAVLVPQDVQALFTAIRRLTAQGLGVLFISHKLDEVCEIADEVSVLRKGVVTGTRPTAGTDPRALAELMVGRPTVGVRRADREDDSRLNDRSDRPDESAAAPPVLQVSGVRLARSNGRAILDQLSLKVYGGEIVGVAGVSGNGQTELVRVLAGLTKPDSGTVQVGGNDVTGASPRTLLQAGLGVITEDRHASVVAAMSVEQNLILSDPRRYRRGPFLQRKAVRRNAEELIARFGIKAAPADPIGSLSGGNMQKVLLARTLAADPAVVVAAQPTRGLDVGAAEFVQEQLLARRAAGGGILLISEDLQELLALADRILVMFAGSVVANLPYRQADPQTLGLLMSGHADGDAA